MSHSFKYNCLILFNTAKSLGYMGHLILQRGILGILHVPAYIGTAHAWGGGGLLGQAFLFHQACQAHESTSIKSKLTLSLLFKYIYDINHHK
jgi:hypothetical protein